MPKVRAETGGRNLEGVRCKQLNQLYQFSPTLNSASQLLSISWVDCVVGLPPCWFHPLVINEVTKVTTVIVQPGISYCRGLGGGAIL